MKALMIVAICLLAQFSFPCMARALQVGHVSPTAGNIRVMIGDLPPIPLHYQQFTLVHLPAGEHRVRVSPESDPSATVLDQRFSLVEDALLEPLLLVAGGVNGFPLDAFVHQHAEMQRAADSSVPSQNPFTTGPIPPGGRVISLVGMAPIGTIELPDTQAHLKCVNGSSSSESGGRFGYGHASTSIGRSSGTGPERCDLTTFHAATGALRLSSERDRRDRTSRMLLIGDGVQHPFELIELIDGEIVARSEELPVMPGATIDATFAWYDVSRPSQGISLFELPASELVYGTWHTFTADGRPIWYLIDGVHDGIPGRRDLRVLELRGSDNKAFVEVGGGKLFYLDCNRAELRLMVDDDVPRTLRIERAKPVSSCAAFNE